MLAGTKGRKVPKQRDRVQRLVRPVVVYEKRLASYVEWILHTLGFEKDDPGLKDTPHRVARALLEYTEGYRQKLVDVLKTTFPDEGYGRCDEMIIQRDIPFSSLCEHHMVPFLGRAHVAYIPRKRIVGLSKMARLVDHFAHRLQVQERLTEQVADTMMEHLKPRGVGVLIEAEHLCMSTRGVKKSGSTTVTSALKGCFRKPEVRQEFLLLATGK